MPSQLVEFVNKNRSKSTIVDKRSFKELLSYESKRRSFGKDIRVGAHTRKRFRHRPKWLLSTVHWLEFEMWIIEQAKIGNLKKMSKDPELGGLYYSDRLAARRLMKLLEAVYGLQGS